MSRDRFFGFSGRAAGGDTSLGTVLEGTVDVPIRKYWSVNGYAGTMWGGGVVSRMFTGTRLTFWSIENVFVSNEGRAQAQSAKADRPTGGTLTDATVVRDPDPSLITTLHVTYALHALGLAIGAFGASTVVGAFIFGWPSIIAVIINYVKRGDARGTWLESHFRGKSARSGTRRSVGGSGVPRRPASHAVADRLRDLVGRPLRARHLGDLSHRARLVAPQRSQAGRLTFGGSTNTGTWSQPAVITRGCAAGLACSDRCGSTNCCREGRAPGLAPRMQSCLSSP